ncbi:hypothetical protein JOB18_049664 [Solea senegalensis]|uniref:Leucine-, glutamate- and lysine-rich protein 1 n=2 Tax=Solea senegalensis TaxID=28829 RepID=A0AAV6Q309_SOLSE|nr:leucine-, glutamate- and lysine-rich protein 1 isoform X1 [Solea senegalensis]KAG7480381.1 hypothetical protein JOB18_049664 [Solea senegalensis]
MGDKERSIEAKGEQKEMMTVPLCPPIYPLPEEIKKMERSDTVCQYCGISYLIYHEFHQLNTRLAQLEMELQGLRETAQREKAQREALEMGRVEWERSLNLEVQIKAEKKKNNMKEELEKKNIDAERFLREEFEKKRRAMEEDHKKIIDEKEKQLRKELGDVGEKRLRTQRDELERKSEEREKVLSDALQKANKNLDELRKYLQQLEHSLAVAASLKEDAEQLLGQEKQHGEMLRGVCVQQVKVLQATLSTLRSSGRELADIRGFLGQLTGAWQAFKTQILQHSAQASSVLKEVLKHSSEELHKMREERENLNQQLTELRKRSEEQLFQQEESDKKNRDKILRLKAEMEEKRDRWLSCQQTCDTIQDQLSLWQQREEQTNQRYCSAKEEVTQLKEVLEKVQQETRDLKRERDALIDSHGRALENLEKDFTQEMALKLAGALEEQKTQSGSHLREQMEELHREVELELSIDREKNQLLLLQYQRDSTQLQQKLKHREQELGELKEELLQERRSMAEERRTQDEQRRRREEIHKELHLSRQQEALQLSEAKSELQLMKESNAELQEEVVLLQETVRRECQEREDLTAALSEAQEELHCLRSPVSHQDSLKSPLNPIKRNTPLGNKHFHFLSHSRIPLNRASSSPKTLTQPSPAWYRTDRSTDGGVAGKSLESWNGGEVLGGGKLPRLKVSSTVSEVKHKVTSGMGRK